MAQSLQVTPARGLSQKDVLERRGIYGPNRLLQQARKSALVILLKQFKSIIVWLLTAAAILSVLLGDHAEAIAIAVVLAINAAIGFFTELRASRSMEALLRIAEVRTRVRRDGRVQEIDARDIVPGDIVILDAGDVVTADLRLIRASNLFSDESVLTGESLPVEKTTDAAAPDAGIGDRVSMVFKGTSITRGTGEGVVTATGMATELGRISDLAQTAEGKVAPLERRLDHLGRRLVWLTLGLALLTIGAGVLRGHAMVEMIQTGVALAVAAVPEGLPVVATLCLARGMWRMAERNAVITNLSSVETLGATTVILTDKTGTLTENRMSAVRYLLSDADVGVHRGEGRPRFDSNGSKVDPDTDDRLGWALRVGALCSNAEFGDAQDAPGSTDPMELALLDVAEAANLGAQAREAYAYLDQHAFDPDLKMMATLHSNADRVIIAVKGAPEAVIPVCDSELAQGGVQAMDAARRAEWIDRGKAAANEGLRLLALAMKQADDREEAPYERLTLVGLVCFLDPLREDVPGAISASLRAGVRVVMVTGDHANTAATIAGVAGLGKGPLRLVEGHALRDVDTDNPDEDTATGLLQTDVFARVAPDTKLKLVAIYQNRGHVVAMTGDGVNDAPALKKADIGIAMGQRGTQVAREAADMVLRDDAFGTIIEAMRQGRIIYDNIRRFVVYLMSCNISEVLVVGLAVGAGLPAPLLPLQILFLNLVTDVFPAFALGFGKGDDQIMQRPPRDPAEPIVDRRHWIRIGVLGALITAATLGAFALALFRLGLEPPRAVTVAFLTLALAQLWNVFNMRASGSHLFRNQITTNPYVWGALVLCSVLIAGAIAFPAAAGLLGLPDPGIEGLALGAGMSLIPLVLGQVVVALGWTGRPSPTDR